jgi:ribosomal protein S18 acetylase RimI-like enzyme
MATPDHYFYEVQAEADSPVIGFVWFGSVPRRGNRVAFVFQIFIYPEYRRQGHGRAALQQVEALATCLGLPEIALNVFGSNVGAQALYRSLGYTVTTLSMHKPLAKSRAA